MMLLSSHVEYKTAVTASAKGDFDTARTNLARLAQIAEDVGDNIRLSYLLQLLGDVEARDGKADVGHAHHRRAIELSPNIPLVLINYAAGLQAAFKRPDMAAEQLKAAERLISSGDWDAETDNISRVWYTRRIAELRDKKHEP